MDNNPPLIRPALPSDLPFLKEMLFEAFFWRPEQPRPARAEFESNVEFSKLLRGWGREGDRAMIAELRGRPVGAAWFRLWTDGEHSFGYWDEATPELGLAVHTEQRGAGIGRALLGAVCEQARTDGYAALSLSVEPDNFVQKMYESEGFVKVGERGKAWTLVKTLR